MADEISIASLIISIIILIVVIIIIVIIIGYANNNNNSKQLKNNFAARPEIGCGSGQLGTSQCCGKSDRHTCTTEVYGKSGHCSAGICILQINW